MRLCTHLLPYLVIATLMSAPTFAGDETGRTLYDRNRRLRQYQKQRGVTPCESRSRRGCYYQDENGDYYYKGGSEGPDLTYWGPDKHPDNAGNEDR